MAKVLVLSSLDHLEFDPWIHGSAFLLKHSAEVDRFRQHSLTEDPTEADIILFAEMGMVGRFAEVVRAHPYYRRYKEKCFLFDSGDFFFPTVPGIYASQSKEQYRRGGTRAGYYLYLIENAFITYRPCTGSEPYLASFVGNRTSHPVREQLFHFNRRDIYVRDTSSVSGRITYHGGPEERARFWSEYADSIAASRFSLCPRGAGAGSIRLYESMKMGRACVILSDEWQPNSGIDWDSFSITVAERDAAMIPEILERAAGRCVEMGMRARQTWEDHFSERVRFHRMVELCLDIRREGKNSRLARDQRALRYTANPRNTR